MNVLEALKSALKQLLDNKARTILTMMGMFIGIGAVIMILALGSGLTENMLGSFKDMGLGSFIIQTKQNKAENYITDEEVALLKEMPEIKCLVPANQIKVNLQNKVGDKFECTVTGAEPEYTTTISEVTLLSGRHLSQKDEQVRGRNILIADSVARALFDNTEEDLSNAVGETINITIDEQPMTFEVVGVYDGQMGSNLTKKELEDTISYMDFYIPYSTLSQALGMQGKTSTVFGLTYEEYDQVRVTTQIGQILNKRHHLIDGYSITTSVVMMEMAESTMNVITLFISAIASISLIVGGVGIMNIMLVTVKERTKEIGIRKALGASNKGILGQFIIEALILTLIAGIIGMIIGYVGAFIVGGMINITARFTVGMLLFSTLTSITIGLIFGVYPAYQAAQLDPIEALRAD